MSLWQPLSKTQHRTSGWSPYTSYAFAQQEAFAPALLAEVDQLLGYYPLAFLSTPTGFQLVALLALEAHKNVYVSPEGRWLAPYVPAFFRSYPFRLLPNPDNQQQPTLCLDADSSCITTPARPQAQAFFDAQGQITPPLQEVITFLKQCQQNQRLTQQAVNQLAQHQLLQPWDLPLPDCYQINPQALSQLNPSQSHALFQSNALYLAHAQQLSQARVRDLKGRQQQATNTPAATSTELNLDQVFGEQADDVFRF